LRTDYEAVWTSRSLQQQFILQGSGRTFEDKNAAALQSIQAPRLQLDLLKSPTVSFDLVACPQPAKPPTHDFTIPGG
jgi:hypothetical protein